MKRFLPFAVCLLLLLLGISSQAQKNAAAQKLAKKISLKTTASAGTNAQQTAQKAVSSLTRHTATARKAALRNQAQRSLFIVGSDTNPAPATGFVIEERFNGKSFLWGVTAAHLIDAYEAPFMMFMIDGQPMGFNAATVVKGHRDGADIALLLLPPQAAEWVKPLSISRKTPKTGEKTFSIGYAAGVFKQVQNRELLETNPFRLVTSYEMRHTPRRGYCGSPLLNAQNEVIGVHCGSDLQEHHAAWRSDFKKLKMPAPDVSLAVPVQHISDLLAQYRLGQYRGIPLKAGNIFIGALLPHQHIMQVAVIKNNRLEQAVNGGPFVDPTRLERFLTTAGADGLLVTVYDPAEQEKQIIEYIVNFKTARVEKQTRTLSGKPPFSFRVRKIK